jgi:hypothetical protein
LPGAFIFALQHATPTSDSQEEGIFFFSGLQGDYVPMEGLRLFGFVFGGLILMIVILGLAVYFMRLRRRW